jgi:hypothetical protein
MRGHAVVAVVFEADRQSGRSQPSRAMLLRLARALDIPIRERNQLLLAAGYAPLYPGVPPEWRTPDFRTAPLPVVPVEFGKGHPTTPPPHTRGR